MKFHINHSKSGFTLIELIVTAIVIGVLATLAIPSFQTVIERSRAAEGISILDSLRKAQLTYFYENRVFATDINQLDITIPPPDSFNALTDASVDSAPANIAEVTRSSGAYRISINSDGDLTCTDLIGALCDKIGL